MLFLLLFLLRSVSAQISPFHQKCDSFERPSLFYNESCFIATETSHTTSDSDWGKLHSYCTDMPNFKHRLAFIWTKDQINKLVEKDVIKPNVSLYVGSRQNPAYKCINKLCNTCPDPDQFYYFDENLKLRGKVNRNLWLRKQPDNKGPDPNLPERLIALEHANRFYGPENQIGFNDVDGVHQNFPLLCEYKNNLACPEGMHSIQGGMCLGLWNKPSTPDEAEKICSEIKYKGHRGTLPSIHNDEANTYLANTAREMITKNKWFDGLSTKDFQQYWPVLFGMKFKNDLWTNIDGTQIDYFRWWSLEKPNVKPMLFKNPTKGHKHAFLMVRTNGNDGIPTFGYWGNVFKETQKVPFFFCTIKQSK